MSAFRLVALDIDGTLLTSGKTITPRTGQAVREAARRGMRIVLVTGRRYPSACQVVAQLGLFVPLVLHNGALVIEEGVVLQYSPLSRATAARVVALGRSDNAGAVVHWGPSGEGLLFVEAGVAPHESLERYLGNSRDGVRVVGDLEAALPSDPVQVMFGGSLESMADLFPRIGEALGDAVTATRTVYPRFGCAFIDVLRHGVSKGVALSFLCRRYGIAAAETLAIGDNWNDLEMLASAGLGLVMGGADPELAAAGFPVLPSSDDDGVAVALERYVLSSTLT